MLFSPQQLHTFLNTFRADALTGAMTVPIIKATERDLSDLTIHEEAISMESAPHIVQTYELLDTGTSEFVAEDSSELIFPYLGNDGAWDKIAWNGHGAYHGEVVFIKNTLSGEAVMNYVYDNSSASLITYIDYYLKFQILGVRGLRRFYDLPNDASLEAIRSSMYETIGMGPAKVQEFYEEQQRVADKFAAKGASPYLVDRMRNRDELKSDRRQFGLHADVDPVEIIRIGDEIFVDQKTANSFGETIYLADSYHRDKPDAWFNPLTPALHELWNLLLNPVLDGDLHRLFREYFALTKRLYATPAVTRSS